MKKFEVIITRWTEFFPVEVNAKTEEEASDLVISLQDEEYHIRKQNYQIETREV
jgi:hypothetical protein